MQKAWKIQERVKEGLIEQLLVNRGLISKEEQEKFFNPMLEDYQKELEILGISKALKRINQAIEKQELIVVYGDYDVDGVTACAILYKALTSIGAKVLPYIPHREKEGYGLSKVGLEFARDSGAAVVITVDNGIVALEQALFAKEIGLDLIITDHHLPLEQLPEAFGIVHSTQMCGAAVAWCLIREVVSQKLANELLQFVAIATVCDLMPLQGVNRAFLSIGIQFLRKTDNLGLEALFLECGIEKKEIGSFEIGHIIGPRINAIGRLEHAIDALRLLCTQDKIKAKRLAKLLSDTNIERQKMTSLAVDQAREMIKIEKKIQILTSEDWSQGIIGLIAGRITEEVYVPSIAIAIGKDGKSKGSARSIKGVNIVEVIRSCNELLMDVGGHAGAAGFSLQTENIEQFILKMEEKMEQFETGVRVLEIEAQVKREELTKKLVKDLEKFAPFGFGNPQIVLSVIGVEVSGLRTLSEGKHLKFKAEGIDAIGFGLGELEKEIKNGQTVDLAFNLEINKFRGEENLQLKLKDVRISNK